MSPKPRYPNLEKLRRASDSVALLASFVSWLNINGVTLDYEQADKEVFTTLDSMRPGDTIYLFFGLDKEAIEAERRSLLDSMDESS